MLCEFTSGAFRLFRENSTDAAEVTIDPCECQLVLGDEEAFNLTLYLGNSEIELYANDRISMRSRIYPMKHDAQGLRMVCRGGSVRRK